MKGVDPASRPAGLTLRTPAATDASKELSSLAALEGMRGGAVVEKHPVRRTIDWTPAPLLCKRLNVPVPKTSSAGNWAMNGGGAAAAAEHGVPASLRKFVPDSSAASLPKVCFLLFFAETPNTCFMLWVESATSQHPPLRQLGPVFVVPRYACTRNIGPSLRYECSRSNVHVTAHERMQVRADPIIVRCPGARSPC